MLAGHFATALVAKQQAPRGHMAYYIAACQLPDLLWQVFHYLGLETTQPDNVMLASLDTLKVDMIYSHHLLPVLGWVVLAALFGRAVFGAWRTGLVGGGLVAVHALTDYIAGHPHNIFGPETHSVSTGMYHTAPYIAVALEAVFVIVVMAWVLRTDARRGVRRSRATWAVWAGVFGGGVAFMFFSADLSIVEMTGVEPLAAMSGSMVPSLIITYAAMSAALLWAEARPMESVATDG